MTAYDSFGRVKSGLSDRQLNSDSDRVCFIFQILE